VSKSALRGDGGAGGCAAGPQKTNAHSQLSSVRKRRACDMRGERLRTGSQDQIHMVRRVARVIDS